MANLSGMKAQLEEARLEDQLAQLSQQAAPTPAQAPAQPGIAVKPKAVATPRKTAHAKAQTTPAATAADDGLLAWQKQAKARSASERVHIGAWVHRDFKRGILRLRAITDEEVTQIFERLLNAEFAKHKLPVVES